MNTMGTCAGSGGDGDPGAGFGVSFGVYLFERPVVASGRVDRAVNTK